MTTTAWRRDDCPKQFLRRPLRVVTNLAGDKRDFIETIETARKLRLGIVGGQVQYVLPDGTCELHWLSYDPKERYPGEDWLKYCDRTADETIRKFKELIARDIEKEALTFEFLRDKKSKSLNIDDYKTFIVYFDDKETDRG